MSKIVVLTTGMGGFGAAYRLNDEGISPVMYDKNAYYGEHTASFRNESGFLFDVGLHYPTKGGFVSYLNKFVPMGNLKLNHELISIDTRVRQLKFSNGQTI